jgi:hypothetical protein
VHFKLSSNVHPLGVEKVHKSIPSYWDNPMAHPVWTDQEVNTVARTHKKPSNLTDYTALAAVGLCKFVFDSITFFKWGKLTEKKVLNRAIFLETVAAVPGMVSLRAIAIQT